MTRLRLCENQTDGITSRQKPRALFQQHRPEADLVVPKGPMAVLAPSETLAAKFAVLQQTSAPNVISSACPVPWQEGSHETARFRHAHRRRGSSVAAGGASAAAGDTG